MPELIVILLEDSIDEREKPSDDMTNGLASTFVGLGSLVIGAEPRNQALVQLCPLCFGLDRVPSHQVHDFLHLTQAPFAQTRPVEGDTCLGRLGGPSEVGFEMSRIFKIGNVTNAGENGCGIHRADGRNRKQNLSFSAVFHNLADFLFKPFLMLLKKA